VYRTLPLRFSRQDGQKIYMERPILGLDERVIPPRKCMNYRYYRSEITGTTGPRRFSADMNYRWMAEGGAVWRENELPVLPVLDRYYRCRLVLPVEPDRYYR
jgi:hypothetical protein